MKSAAAENEKIAALLRNKPLNASSIDPSIAATFVAIALEAAIIGLTAFIELFLRPTPLPALVKFNDKLVDWGLDDDQLQNLTISASPSAGTVALPRHEQKPPRVARITAGAVRDDVPDVFNCSCLQSSSVLLAIIGIFCSHYLRLSEAKCSQ